MSSGIVYVLFFKLYNALKGSTFCLSVSLVYDNLVTTYVWQGQELVFSHGPRIVKKDSGLSSLFSNIGTDLIEES